MRWESGDYRRSQNADKEAEEVRRYAALDLPKGTEHFLSDLHGEHAAFSHILRSCSGVIRRKLDLLFSGELSEGERAELATLIYYPRAKLSELYGRGVVDNGYLLRAIEKILRLLRFLSRKYTQGEVARRIGSGGFFGVVYDMLSSRGTYSTSLAKRAVERGYAASLIEALSTSARRLAVHRLHIVGDIFDRGARPDLIMDALIGEAGVDIQWGNHDALWMCAASGCRAAICAVINNTLAYGNTELLELGYGISLRSLARFAERTYRGTGGLFCRGADGDEAIPLMRLAIAVIQYKLEGELILENPDFGMEDRLLLSKLDPRRGVVEISGREYKTLPRAFPTIEKAHPYKLTRGEAEVIEQLYRAFVGSERLARHIEFLYSAGSAYKVYNGNLLFHGAIPLDKNGDFMPLAALGGKRGRALMDAADRAARDAFYAPLGSDERRRGQSILWFLWCGKNSPLSARERITSFERSFIADQKVHAEPKNAYLNLRERQDVAARILAEFSLDPERGHIINGHTPIRRAKGESPIKAGGRVIVIDGGFCSAYHKKTGIAGYTLIYNAEGMRILAHRPFPGTEAAVRDNLDIHSEITVFEVAKSTITVGEIEN